MNLPKNARVLIKFIKSYYHIALLLLFVIMFVAWVRTPDNGSHSCDHNYMGGCDFMYSYDEL